jgi:hypothetical protein
MVNRCNGGKRYICTYVMQRFFVTYMGWDCSRQEKPGSWSRRSEAHN